MTEPNRIRLARLGRGLSQDDLARASGVTRQAIAGIESGRWDPSLKVSLAMARALGSSVEDLFGHDEPAGPAVDALDIGSTQRPGTPRVAHAAVGDRWVAMPLAGDAAIQAGFGPASGAVVGTPAGAGPDSHLGPRRQSGKGTLSDGAAISPQLRSDWAASSPNLRIEPLGPVPSTLVVAGCDPAIPLLEAPLAALRTPVRLLWVPCSSARALDLLRQGGVHAAGAHLSDPATGTFNSPHVRSVLKGVNAEVVGFARWREGIVVHRKWEKGVQDLDDVARLGLSIVNREPGAEARNVLEREMERCGIGPGDLAGFSSAAGGHLMVAAAIAAGLADAGIACEAAAATYDLAFLPLVEERFDFVIPTESMSNPQVSGLVQALGSAALRRQLTSLPGYDPGVCGEVVDVI